MAKGNAMLKRARGKESGAGGIGTDGKSRIKTPVQKPETYKPFHQGNGK